MKILIFGSTGYIGTEFTKQLCQVKGIDITSVFSRAKNIESYTYRNLEKTVVDSGADVVINCSGYVGTTSSAACENNKDETIQSNVIFPKMLSEICDTKGIIFCHMSTGCIYNGYVKGGYTEDMPRQLGFEGLCSFYTGTKAMAEDYLKYIEKKYVWRIRLPFDEYDHPKNYLSKLMNFDKISVAENSISNRKELANACIFTILNKVPYGTYNVVNPGSIRTDEIIVMFKRVMKNNKKYGYFEGTEQLDKLKGVIISNTTLNTDKLQSVGVKMTDTYESVEWCLKNWKSI